MPTITTGVVYQGETTTFSTFAVSTGLIPLWSMTVPEYSVIGYDVQIFSRPQSIEEPGRTRWYGTIYRGTGDAINNGNYNITAETYWFDGSALPYISGSVVTFKVSNSRANNRFFGTYRFTMTKQEWSV